MGWPNYIKDETLKPYFTRRNELSVEQGCILWGIRVIIPPAHREQLLHDLHQGHPGGSKMKNLARSYLWWPQLDKDIEHAVQQCNACQSVRKLPEPAPLHCWQWPTRVWQRIHIDFAEKEQHNFLVLVDSHSKWLEVIQMKTTTAAKTIEVLRNIFSSYGLPEEIVSDNGPQFTSQEYKAFLQNNGIKQTLVPAYHPASNGAAERAVQTVKASLQKQVLDEKKQNITITMQHRLANVLFSYRCTPHSVTGCTPAELFLKRQIRTRFSLLKPDLAKVVDGKQQKQKYYHDRPASTLRHLSEGDSVLIRNFRGGRERWTEGIVEKRLGPVTYWVWNGVNRRSVHIDHLLYKRPSSPETMEFQEQQTGVQDNYPAVVGPDVGGKGTPGAVGGSPYSPEATPLPQTQAKDMPVTPLPVSAAADKAVTPANSAARSTEVLERRYPRRERAPPKRLNL
uniref:Gypsy retrotransposon integrase-like protein 1 n=1 Tax=Nothobranchius furzeri TaxID=105023 RepID=A0A1A8UU84_NOTFU